MSKALTIFKKAGLADYLSSAASSMSNKAPGMMQSIKPYLTPTLMGAGIGGLGMGAASYLGGGEEDESGGDKFNRVLRNSLMGAGLGAAGGAGYQAVFGKPGGGGGEEINPALKQYADIAKAEKHSFDPRSFGEAHPFQSAMYSGANMSPMIGIGVGGARGMYNEFKNYGHGAMSKAYEKATEAFKPSGKGPRGGPAPQPIPHSQVAEHMLTNVLHAGGHPAAKRAIMEYFANNHKLNENEIFNLFSHNAKDVGEISRLRSMASGTNWMKSVNDNPMNILPDKARSWMEGFRNKNQGPVPQLDPRTLGYGGGAAAESLRLGSKLQAGHRAAGGLIRGGAKGLALQEGLGFLVNRGIAQKYHPEQLDAWRAYNTGQ